VTYLVNGAMLLDEWSEIPCHSSDTTWWKTFKV